MPPNCTSSGPGASPRTCSRYSFAMRSFSCCCRSLSSRARFFFFARRLGDAQLVEFLLYVLLHQLFFQNQRMLNRLQSHLLATRENFMTSVFLVPLGQRRRQVHLFDDV